MSDDKPKQPQQSAPQTTGQQGTQPAVSPVTRPEPSRLVNNQADSGTTKPAGSGKAK